MAKAGTNRYRVDLRDMHFVLFEQFKIGEILGSPPFEHWDEATCRETLKQSVRFATEVLGPLNASGDREGCRLESGQVRAPAGFKEAWQELYHLGFKSVAVPADHGGQGGPYTLHAVIEEMLSGSNCSFSMYSGLTAGALDLVEAFATPEQKHRYFEKMLTGVWSGTMCLTEPHAGSDVGAASTRARRNGDGTYSIQGTKIFISAGDHDMTQNVVHMVLARVEGAAPGTKGLSLFIVPKLLVRPDGSLGERNDVSVGGLEHKIGLNGSATCVLNFGENGRCVGELIGSAENLGMSQMFRLMNTARIAVGIQGLGIASSAYLNALDYARERKQGSSIKNFKDPNAPRVPILEHADVRRMLLDMKSKVEGTRAVLCKLTMHMDRARALAGRDEEKAAYHRGQVDLLTPLLKAYSSEQAWTVCATALQVFGGAGVTRDHPVEQYARDAKVFTIYEGTTHIQAMDLVARKLGQAGGAPLMAFMGDVGAFVETHRSDPALGEAVKLLAQAQQAVGATARTYADWSQSGKLELVAATANRFLELMSELTVGWLLLEAAAIGEKAAAGLAAGHPDRAFYQGKKGAALFYARNALAGAPLKAQQIAAADRTAIDLPAEAFATV
jgi:alkylation response protein AidB-like acyl-CoA dehydrogenase